MRTYLLLLSFLFFCQLANAQFIISSDSIFVDVEAGDHYGSVDIQNDSIAGNILWVLTTECEPENWVHYVMDINIAYIPGIDSLGFELAANQTASLWVFLLLPELPGMAKYTMEIWKEGDRENGKFVQFYFNDTDCSITNTDEVGSSIVPGIYPNPFDEKIIVESTDARQVELWDSTGRLMFRREIPETAVLGNDLNSLNEGTYFLVLKSKTGQVIHSRIMVKN